MPRLGRALPEGTYAPVPSVDADGVLNRVAAPIANKRFKCDLIP
jgi:hypothetical protein